MHPARLWDTKELGIQSHKESHQIEICTPDLMSGSVLNLIMTKLESERGVFLFLGEPKALVEGEFFGGAWRW